VNGVLSNRLALLAEMQDEAIRDRLHAALRIGAMLALARISEVGGSYPTGSDFKAVMTELDGKNDRGSSPETPEAVPPAPVDPVPDIPF